MTGWPRSTPRQARIVGLLLLGVIGLALVALWIAPAALTRQSDGLDAAERLKAANDVRAPLVAFVLAIGALGTLWFTSRTYVLNREGHLTDRYSKAVGQLGDQQPAVRVGGVYALGRVGINSPYDVPSIIVVLGAFIRDRAKVPGDRPPEPPEDVKAGLRVAARLLAASTATLDLRGATLSLEDLSDLPRDRVTWEWPD